MKATKIIILAILAFAAAILLLSEPVPDCPNYWGVFLTTKFFGFASCFFIYILAKYWKIEISDDENKMFI